MKVVAKPRGNGKTVEMIKQSAKTGYPILTRNDNETKNIKITAMNLGIEIPSPISFSSHKRGQTINSDSVIIDNAEFFLQDIIKEKLHVDIDTCSVNIPYKIPRVLYNLSMQESLMDLLKNGGEFELID